MSVQQMTEPVAVWLESGRPVRLVWRGLRYTVTDTPTALRREEKLHEVMTHPLVPVLGWRFQATNCTGEALVFDVQQGNRDVWELVAIYS